MLKRLLAGTAVAMAAAVGASAANATNFPIYQCPYHSTAGDKTYYGGLGNPNPNNTVYISSATSYTLHFGWAAQKLPQVQQFLKFQFGGGASIYDTGDLSTPVFTYPAWPVGGDLNAWSAPALAPYTVTGPNGKQVQVYVTNHNTPFPTLTAGHTYLFSIDLELRSGVNDGYNASPPGSWLKITDCSVTVN